MNHEFWNKQGPQIVESKYGNEPTLAHIIYYYYKSIGIEEDVAKGYAIMYMNLHTTAGN